MQPFGGIRDLIAVFDRTLFFYTIKKLNYH